ncbi:hypothetical protein Btru_040728 [Bulinus truncatus]|nr:hypothetical protein Btru_040728 [Bulinus truncatus]
MASNEANLKTKALTATDIKEIYSLNNEISAKELLAKKLALSPFQDKNDPQKPQFITYIYNNIKFAAEMGIPWEEIPKIVKFAHEFLKQILVENHKLGDAVLDLNTLSHLLDSLNSHHKKQYLDFIYDTVLTHYNLYKYVFSTLREVNNPKIHKDVAIPPKPLPLVFAKEKSVFEYDDRIKKLDKLESQTISQLKEKMFSNNTSEHHTTVDELDNIPLPYDRMALWKKKERELIFHADETIQDLTFKFEKTIIPRPVVLGSPPRFDLGQHTM